MAQIATTFWFAGSQAVRLPREFWFEGDEMRIERRGALIVLTPVSGPSARSRDFLAPPPGANFAGFLGPRPEPGRSLAEIQAEVHRLFAPGAANDNEPLARSDTP